VKAVGSWQLTVGSSQLAIFKILPTAKKATKILNLVAS
jgi:hypothetical protein